MMKSLDATNTKYSGAVLKSPLGDVNVYRLPHLGILLRADAIQQGALKTTSVFKSTLKHSSRSALALVREVSDVILGISGFLKTTCHPRSPPHTQRHLLGSTCSQNPDLHLSLALAGCEEQTWKIQTNKGRMRQLPWAEQRGVGDDKHGGSCTGQLFVQWPRLALAQPGLIHYLQTHGVSVWTLWNPRKEDEEKSRRRKRWKLFNMCF